MKAINYLNNIEQMPLPERVKAIDKQIKHIDALLDYFGAAMPEVNRVTFVQNLNDLKRIRREFVKRIGAMIDVLPMN